jgi:hypothetical protein
VWLPPEAGKARDCAGIGGKPDAPLPFRTCGINQIPFGINQIPFEEKVGTAGIDAL